MLLMAMAPKLGDSWHTFMAGDGAWGRVLSPEALVCTRRNKNEGAPEDSNNARLELACFVG